MGMPQWPGMLRYCQRLRRFKVRQTCKLLVGDRPAFLRHCRLFCPGASLYNRGFLLAA